MTVLFADTPDATQGKEFWDAQVGTVDYETAVLTSGLASWKCDTAAGANAYLQSENVAQGENGRLSVRVKFTDFQQSIFIGVADVSPSIEFGVGISGSGVLALGVSVENYDATLGTGSTLTTGVVYRISIAWTITSATVHEIRVYLDGIEDISESNGGTLAAGSLREFRIGWGDFPSNNQVMNFAHVFLDDGDHTDGDPGDIRVTAKLPNSNETNNYDTNTGNNPTNRWENVNERILSETNGWEETRNTDQRESFGIEADSAGDVDISGDTLVGFIYWIWAKRDSGGAGSPAIVHENVETNIVLTSGTFRLFQFVETTTSYPTTTSTIGAQSTDAAADSHLAECGVLAIYIPPAAADGGESQVHDVAIARRLTILSYMFVAIIAAVCGHRLLLRGMPPASLVNR